MMNEQQAIGLLKKHSTGNELFEKVLAHSKKVQEIALRFAVRIPGADSEFIRVAAILHDIGRFRCPPGKDSIRHGVVGAGILRKEGLGESYARVCETHIGAGISEKDIERQGLSLPKKDYMPMTIEEKIICDADSLVFGKKERSIEEVIDRYRQEVNGVVAERARKLHEEILSRFR